MLKARTIYDNTKYAGDEDVVMDGHECPKCGECRIDYLVIDGDEHIRCATCGTVYALETAEEG
jgi:LSD1 subclass zinc finger protein